MGGWKKIKWYSRITTCSDKCLLLLGANNEVPRTSGLESQNEISNSYGLPALSKLGRKLSWATSGIFKTKKLRLSLLASCFRHSGRRNEIQIFRSLSTESVLQFMKELIEESSLPSRSLGVKSIYWSKSHLTMLDRALWKVFWING